MQEIETITIRGVLGLTKGEDRNAIACFRESLRLSATLVREAETSDEPTNAYFALRSIPLPSIVEDSTCSMLSVAANFFNEAFVAHLETETVTELHVASAVSLYNTAIMYHRKALERNISYCFRKALDLYNNSVELLSHANADLSDISLLLLAIFNNRAHIHSICFDSESFVSNIQKMHQILHDSSASVHFSKQEVGLFVSGLVLYHNIGSTQFAPAA